MRQSKGEWGVIWELEKLFLRQRTPSPSPPNLETIASRACPRQRNLHFFIQFFPNPRILFPHIFFSNNSTNFKNILLFSSFAQPQSKRLLLFLFLLNLLFLRFYNFSIRRKKAMEYFSRIFRQQTVDKGRNKTQLMSVSSCRVHFEKNMHMCCLL
jgi:hypothetical protein